MPAVRSMLGYIRRRNNWAAPHALVPAPRRPSRSCDITMPELPEVETTRRGLAPHVVGRRVAKLHVYDSRLRWPVPADLHDRLVGREIDGIDRRSKY